MKVYLYIFFVFILFTKCTSENCNYFSSIKTNKLYNCENNFLLEPRCKVDSVIIENGTLRIFNDKYIIIYPNEGADKVKLGALDSLGVKLDQKIFKVIEYPFPKFVLLIGDQECSSKCEMEFKGTVPISFRMEVDPKFREQCYLDSYFTFHSFDFTWYRETDMVKYVSDIPLERKDNNTSSRFTIKSKDKKRVVDSIINNAKPEDYFMISTSKIIKEGARGQIGKDDHVLMDSHQHFVITVD